MRIAFTALVAALLLVATGARPSAGADAPEQRATLKQAMQACRAQVAQATEELKKRNGQQVGAGKTSLQWTNADALCGCAERRVMEKVPRLADDTPVAVREWTAAIGHCTFTALREAFPSQCMAGMEMRVAHTGEQLSTAQRQQACDCTNDYLRHQPDNLAERVLAEARSGPNKGSSELTDVMNGCIAKSTAKDAPP